MPLACAFRPLQRNDVRCLWVVVGGWTGDLRRRQRLFVISPCLSTALDEHCTLDARQRLSYGRCPLFVAPASLTARIQCRFAAFCTLRQITVYVTLQICEAILTGVAP